jgi:aspartate/methionine/tyrosine aminotransferase
MPLFPQPSRSAREIRFSSFGSTAGRVADLASQGLLIPLHLGDTYLPPPTAAMEVSLRPDYLHRYGHLEGFPELRLGIAARLGERFGLQGKKDDLFITPGAIGALSLLADALFDPGEEVIVLTPSWPVIFGILTRRGLSVKEVPVGFDGVPEANPDDFIDRLQSAISTRTRGIYFCNPNNPSGFVFTESYSDAITNLALEHSLWILEDVAYGELVFEGHFKPVSCDPRIQNRSLVIGTFSKSHALAGHRVGYLLAPPEIRGLFARLLMHTTYHTSTVAQSMALACLQCSNEEEQKTLASYVEGARIARESLACIAAPAEAGAFVLLDLRPYGITRQSATDEFLDALLDRHVSLCPGSVFGHHYESFARLCFTATRPEELKEGIARINEVLATWEVTR